MSNISVESIRKKAKQWLGEEYDEATRKEVKNLLDNDEKGLVEAFHKELEFGTGGLRGIMGAGTNRMNVYTVGMTSQGLANYILKQDWKGKRPSVAIAHDCRNNSRLFAEHAADIFSANGLVVYLFDSLRPTPELSFAVRHYECSAGIVLTASHNPPEYNGYKVYWSDGGQIVDPHDDAIIGEVNAISSVKEVKNRPDSELIRIIGDEIDELYLEQVLTVRQAPEIIRSNSNIGIVYTPIHGTGYLLVPESLRRFGFTNIFNVPEQNSPDGNFPTVKSPNPEEPDALSMAVAKAKKVNALMVMASDPDADRLGVAVRNKEGEFTLLNGNQTCVLLTWYTMHMLKEKNELKGNEYTIKTIVTTDLLDTIASAYGIKCYNVLTGFKHFASLINTLGSGSRFIGGGEESFGYLPGDYVRDKDAVGSCSLMAEIAAYANSRGQNLLDLLEAIYIEHGVYVERLVNVVRKGIEGASEIKALMEKYRNNPPAAINGSKVINVIDYLHLTNMNIKSGKTTGIDFKKSDVLQFLLEDGSKISVRPSGTEPKIKYYFSVNSKSDKPGYKKTVAMLEKRIDGIISDMGLK